MKHAAIIGISALALALAGCGKKDEAEPQATAQGDVVTTDTESTTPAPELSAGQAFANAAAASDAFEIEASKLAAQKAQSAKIKNFAVTMIAAHTQSTAKLKTAADGATPPIMPDPALNAVQQQTLDALNAKSGADFDTAFAKAQVDAHHLTLDALKAYAATGDVPTLKAFASEMVPTVTKHLEGAKAL